MAKDKKAKKENKTEEEVHEIYEIEKDGKESIVETEGVIKEKNPRKGEIEKENKLLRNILIFIGLVLLVLALSFFITKSATHFKYKGVEFNVIQEGELTFYQTSFPVINKGKVADYNFYLRNDPRILERKVPAPETFNSIDNTVINITQEFDCNGDQVIAIANLVNLYGAVGKKIMKDDNASCDSLGRYTYIVVQPGKKTSVEQFGPSCYNISINNCEILEGTERFIAGMLVKMNYDLSN